MRAIVVTNCVVRNSTYGIALFMKDGGTYENIRFSHLFIETADGRRSGRTTYPIFIDLERRVPESSLGKIRNVTFESLTISTTGHLLAAGMPQSPLEGITFDGLTIDVRAIEDLAKARKPRGVTGLRTAEADYSSIPSVITLAHGKGLMLRNIRMNVEDAGPGEGWHALWTLHAEDVMINGLKAELPDHWGKSGLIVLDDVRRASLMGNAAGPGTSTFLRVSGEASHDISVVGNDLHHARTTLARDRGVRKTAVVEFNNRSK
jgi:hypothetical protein